MRLGILIFLALAISGCASQTYRETNDSRFSGALDVRWIKNDYFLFLPNKDDPLKLIRENGESITPGPMYTDGGSIPRFLWGIEGYSPWGYAPAYIVHDWLFEVKHCGYDSENPYTFSDSVSVIAEGLKAIMEENTEVRNYFVFDSVVASVGSPIAKRLWEHGSCDVPPFDVQDMKEKSFRGEELPGDLLMTIKFE